MAEAVLRHYVKQEGLQNEITIDSAGTYHGHVGSPPHQGTRQKLAEHQISYEGIVARQVEPKDLDRFTYVIGMDSQNVEDLNSLTHLSLQNIYSFVDFIPQTKYTEVPDPYYTGDFEETYQLVSTGCRHLLDRIIQEQGLKKGL